METSLAGMPNSERFNIWLQEARALRTARARAEGSFFLVLRRGEVDEAMWKDGGFLTFAEVLTKTHLTTPARYENFKVLLAHVGEEHIRENGYEESKPLLAIPANVPSRVCPEMSALEAAKVDINNSRVENGVPVSQWQQKSFGANHYVPERKVVDPIIPSVEKPVTYTDRVTELEAKLAEKEREVKRLLREIDKRDKRIATLEAKLKKN